VPSHLILPTYFVVWWITLFFLLPIGVKMPETRDKFHYAGAPTNINLKKKVLWNFALAAVVTLGLHLLFLSGLIPLRNAI
jgi:predicted secreted protein